MDNMIPPEMNDNEKIESSLQLIPRSELCINPDPVCDYEEIKCQFDPQVPFYEKTDFVVAASSGLLTAALDILLVGDTSLKDANNWGTEKVNEFVIKAAKKTGFKGNDLEKAVKHLEKFHLAGDVVMGKFGGGLQHHLRDFSHHPTVIGLAFSLLTQFTGMVYGTDLTGKFIVVPVPNGKYIGETVAEKILFGTVYWMLHMISDMAGSSGSIGKLTKGAGIPGPLLAFMKEVSALPFFSALKDEKGINSFSKWLSKLYNGTANKDGVKFDLRTELGLLYNQMIHSLPVIANELIVRGYFLVSRLCVEIQDKNIKSVNQLNKIDISRIIPIKQRKLTRMLTISTGTFFAITTSVTVVKGIVTENYADIFININYVGVARFAIAVKQDYKYMIEDALIFNNEIQERQTKRNKWYLEQELRLPIFTLTEQQCRILESLKKQKIDYDIRKTKGNNSIKCEWKNEWCQKLTDLFGKEYLISDEPSLYNALHEEAARGDTDWLYLVAIELTRFKPYYPWGDNTVKDKRFKKLHLDSNYENDVFVVLQGYINRTEYIRILNRIHSYDEKLEEYQADMPGIFMGEGLFALAIPGLNSTVAYGINELISYIPIVIVAKAGFSIIGNLRSTRGSILRECSGLLTYCRLVVSKRPDKEEIFQRLITYLESNEKELEAEIALMRASKAEDKDKKLIKIAEANTKYLKYSLREIGKMKQK